MSGSGRAQTSCRTRGSRRGRTGSTRRCSSARSTRCCAAGRSRSARWPAAAPSATGTTRSGGRSSPASGPPAPVLWPVRRPPDVPAPGLPRDARHAAYAAHRPAARPVPAGLAPRRQRYGTVNADGFGVGWYAPDDPVPARYRRPVPIWGDESFADFARVTGASAVLAAVRSATGGTDLGTAAVAPFASGPWLFSHNGKVDGWPDSVAGLAAALPASALLGLEARVDSALLWALVRHRLSLGMTPAQALADTVLALRAAGVTGRFNFLLTDGRVIAATAAGDTLWYRSGSAGAFVTVASEPGDDEPGWTEVPDSRVVTATRQQVSVAELDGQAIMQHQDPEDGRIAI